MAWPRSRPTTRYKSTLIARVIESSALLALYGTVDYMLYSRTNSEVGTDEDTDGSITPLCKGRAAGVLLAHRVHILKLKVG